MKFTLPWLEEHLETTAPLNEITAKLTELGLEVDSVEGRGADLSPFKVAEVIEVRRHPNAERLSLCTANTGDGTVEVVCGAPNAVTGMTGIFAAPGTRIPGTGVDLEVGVIRGVDCNLQFLPRAHRVAVVPVSHAEVITQLRHLLGAGHGLLEVARGLRIVAVAVIGPAQHRRVERVPVRASLET